MYVDILFIDSNMNVNVASEIYDLFPDLKTGIMIISGVNNKIKSKEPYGLLKQACEELRKKYTSTEEISEISMWSEAINTAGWSPEKYPVSLMPLSKSVLSGKDIPSISPFVDLYNSVVVSKMLPMGGYDFDTLKNDLSLRFSKEGDKFTKLFKKESENIEPGEIVFADGNTVMCSKWVWKQDEHHKITEKTKNILVRFEQLSGSNEDVLQTLEEVGKLVTKFCGGKFAARVLSQSDSALHLDELAKEAGVREKTKEEKAIYELLNRGTVDVIVREELEEKLLSGKKLKIKLGIDPTGADLHLGHMVVVKKLAEFQRLGHHIQLLFGNFTGQIGDPTGKNEVRKVKTQEELEENAQNYIKQVEKILDVSKIDVMWNADWLSKLTFSDVTRLASVFTVSQMLERDMFQDRMKKSAPIYVHEFMYPLMQGYDSVAMESDVELGGTDQTFNLLAGRTLQKVHGQVPQNVITVPILEGTDGKIKMGKTTGNYIGVMEEPEEQFGKVMSIPDSLIFRYFELATNVAMTEIDQLKQNMSNGENPRNIKMQLAREIVTLYHSKSAAERAEKHFCEVFQEQKTPENIAEVVVEKGSKLVDILVEEGVGDSKSNVRRVIDGGGVSFNDEKVNNRDFTIVEEGIVKYGKRKFLKLIFT